MAAKTDQEGLMAMLEEATLVSSAAPPQAGMDLELDPELEFRPSRTVQTEDDWATDPVPTKLEKIRAAFLNSKSAAEVTAAAGNMPVTMWLECVIKLMPKDIKVQGEVSFHHMLEGLGPIDANAYRLGAGPVKVVEAEFSEVAELAV
jgi:hypothetical protein